MEDWAVVVQGFCPAEARFGGYVAVWGRLRERYHPTTAFSDHEIMFSQPPGGVSGLAILAAFFSKVQPRIGSLCKPTTRESGIRSSRRSFRAEEGSSRGAVGKKHLETLFHVLETGNELLSGP